MTTRISKKTVTFQRLFVLGELDEVVPASSYRVETEEELLDSISFAAYHRVSTQIYLRLKPGHTQFLKIDPNELDEALLRDQAPTEASASRDTR